MRRDSRNRAEQAKQLADQLARSVEAKSRDVRIEGFVQAALPPLVTLHWLIDGYNLLHASDLIPPDGKAPVLARSRELLLSFLTLLLSKTKASRTLVVFDGMHSPPGLPKSFHYRGLTVQFSTRNQSADDLLEEILEQHPAPKQVTVISSDHRVQRGARSRGANYIDSDMWLVEQKRLGQQAQKEKSSLESEKPAPPASPGEVSKWLDFFE
ncbi:protein of unknown function DUF901 [Pirellula staleyi DSM 6068]|uniref:YacP-like NYN domain protein n=1 Tax=Pirellula staleyi (strain ATCC 27377 / DSM 6068 / ICPB 4128) TaxID=530564 RepID=D2R8R3_PIRSD|nr:NYN domain-containing protein [Pirellula staleyi]ADB17604.1 protein of unknown function DUF901 [Pirellula staleyi DSM 6068]